MGYKVKSIVAKQIRLELEGNIIRLALLYFVMLICTISPNRIWVSIFWNCRKFTMLCCSYLFHFEGTFQKDQSVHLCGIQGCHVSLNNLDFMHTRETFFLSNSTKKCLNGKILRKYYVLWPQEMCSSPLKAFHSVTLEENRNEGHGILCPMSLRLLLSPISDTVLLCISKMGDAVLPHFCFALLCSGQDELKHRTKPQLLYRGCLQLE